MSKPSNKRRTNKSQTSKSQSSKSQTNKSQTYKSQTKGKKAPPKVRGTALTVALVIIILHGLLAAIYYAVARRDPSLDQTWALALMSLHFLLNLIAAIGIWNWKQWGIYLYAASTILAVVVGLMTIGIWSLFYMVLPLAILGWLLRTKWDYFS